MLDGMPLGWLGSGSGWALVALFVILIYRGRLIPRTQFDDKQHEAQEWRTEVRLRDQELAEKNDQLRSKDDQLAEKDRQLEHLGEVGRTQIAMLNALQPLAEKSPPQPDTGELM